MIIILTMMLEQLKFVRSIKNTFKQWFKRIAMAHHKDISENKMLAAYYSAKAEVEQLTKGETVNA